MKTSIAIVDDHRLLAQALSDLVQKFECYEVLFVAENGKDLITYLKRKQIPEILLLDVSMPEMDGFETADYLKEHYPEIKILALTMMDREEYIVRMIRKGVRGYMLKGSRPSELRTALDAIRLKGYYHSEFLAEHLIRSLNPVDPESPAANFNLNQRELEFIQLAASELRYEDIADKMCVSVRTVDGYRESVFQKMKVKTRVGMILMALRWGIIKL